MKTVKTQTVALLFLIGLTFLQPVALRAEETVPIPNASAQAQMQPANDAPATPGSLSEKSSPPTSVDTSVTTSVDHQKPVQEQEPKASGEAATGETLTPAAQEVVENSDVAVDEGSSIADPFAPTNKLMFEINDRLYFWVLKPVTKAYVHIPEDFRIIFSSVYDNLKAPARMLNNLMQLRMERAGNELVRFLINSVVGIGGIGDIARDSFGIKKQDADFGQTLGHYGIDHGFYIVLPLLGPSSLRDGIGRVGDYFMHPLTYVPHEDLSWQASLGILAHEYVNDASFRIGDYESFKESAIDPYIAMRDAFVQNRKKIVEESRH